MDLPLVKRSKENPWEDLIDSWAAIQWVLSNSWLLGYVNLERVFLEGDSSGVNIVHNMAMRAGDVANPVNLLGVALIQPYFWEKKGLGHDDPLVNPFAAEAPSLLDLGCTHVLVFITDQDVYRDRGWPYYETLRMSDWRVVEIMEIEGKDHVFHLFSPTSQKALDMIKRLVNDECKLKFLELKAKRNYRFIVFRIEEKIQQVMVERLGEPDESYEDFSACLPPNECRYAVFDLDFTNEENCQKSKIFFIAWSPENSRVRSKMLYARSKDRFKRVGRDSSRIAGN
ncbi:hypothetical protein GIB67_025019 [Kingdonia uniflora]|uniref:ADF-H domain-containing protein n=1 Tax=Kingdonia uniflora TaxID=39325 RepID=A0A7J7N7N3_9MAGN|nr:hypothetical protein GIB67_025019 [Kingdonia uniflora]